MDHLVRGKNGYSPPHTSTPASGHDGSLATTVASVVLCDRFPNHFDSGGGSIWADCVDWGAIRDHCHHYVYRNCVVKDAPRGRSSGDGLLKHLESAIWSSNGFSALI